jgi:predicted kinase
MKLKLILTKGLPASGKSTWAREYIKKHDRMANLCKDDLRGQLTETKSREKQIIVIRNLLTEHYLSEGYSVIWSDTNLNPIHENKAREIVAKYEAELVIKDFTDVGLEECIKRDLKRLESVGERVIRKMYYDYLYKPDTSPQQVASLPNCYVIDIDGTLARNISRKPFDWSRVGEDLPNELVVKIVLELAKHNQIIVLSGRSDICQQETETWLQKYGIPYASLWMRTNNDTRPDETIKEELYWRHIHDRYNVLGIIDDRPKVCRMWRQLGLCVFQVGNPDYEF